MKQILFRGKADNGWVYGDLIHNMTADPESRYSIRDWDTGKESAVAPESVCMYTGLDKGDVKIWEKDVIRTDRNHFGLIRFGVHGIHHCGFFVDWHVFRSSDGYLRDDLYYWIKVAKNAEVIGNIFEHKELIQEMHEDWRDF